jgi:hypothetical protein
MTVELIHLDDVGDAPRRERERFGGAVADVGDVEWVAGPKVLSVLESAQIEAVKDFGEREGVAVASLVEGHGFFLRVVEREVCACAPFLPSCTEAWDREQRRERYN